MPGKPIIVRPKKKTKGIAERVACPHCGRAMNFSGLVVADGQGAGWGSYGIERGAIVDCDHCGRKSKVEGIQPTIIITLVQEF